jgi:hypothetical protein
MAQPQAYLDMFREAFDFRELGDLGYEGDKFTWSNHSRKHMSCICERLDRAMASREWCDQFPNFRVMKGAPQHSNHKPIVKEHKALCVVLVINDNPNGLMVALSYICRTCP